MSGETELHPRPADAGIKKSRSVQGYSPTVAAKLTGLNYNTILYWVRTELVRASIQYESKQWTPVLFSFEDILELKFIKALREKGAPTQRIRRALNLLRKEVRMGGRADLYLDVTGDEVNVMVSNDSILTALKSQSQLLLINVAVLRTEIEQKAREANIRIA